MNGEVCTTKTLLNKVSTDTTTINNNINNSYKASIPRKYDQNIESIDVCLKLQSNLSEYAKVTINDKTVYVNNASSGYTCADNVDYSEEVITFKCVDCNTTKGLIVYQSKETSLYINGSVGVEKVPQHQIFLKEYCKELYKDILQVYFAIIGLITFIFLLKRGLAWFWRYISSW